MKKIILYLSFDYFFYLFNSFFNFPKIIYRNEFKIFIDRNCLPKKIRKLLFYKFSKYEKEEIKLIELANFNKNNNILELGSSIGITSLYLKKKIGEGKLFCIEPNPHAYKCLLKNLQLNKFNVKCYNKVANITYSELYFYINNNNYLSSSIIENKKSQNNDVSKIKIHSIDINEIIFKELINTLVVDIEGFELNIYKNINYKTINSIIIELHPQIYSTHLLNGILQFYLKKNFKIIHKLNYSYYLKRV